MADQVTLYIYKRERRIEVKRIIRTRGIKMNESDVGRTERDGKRGPSPNRKASDFP